MLYRLIGYADCDRAVLEESNDLMDFIGSIAEIIDTYPEYTAFDVVNNFGNVVASL